MKTATANISKTLFILSIAVLLSEMLRVLRIHNQNLIMVYILPVLIISRITPGYYYGIAAAAASTIVYDFLITEPRMGFSFTIGFPITLCIMLLVTFVTSTLTTRMKEQAQLALDREYRTQLLYEINQKLLAARSVEAIVELTNEYIIAHIKRSVVFYTKNPLLPGSAMFSQASSDDDSDLFLSNTERRTAERIFNNPLELTTNCSFEHPSCIYYSPVVSKENMLGLIGISCENGILSNTSLIFVQMLVGQVTLALELQCLSDERHRILVDAEREHMRSTLLRAISHDLRTPLTSILGASSTILEQNESLDKNTVVKLSTDIKENSQWLIRMVENLLSITRISGENLRVTKTLEAAEEVVAQSVALIRSRFPDCHIHVRSPDDLLMVPMEATLISQVIINLLENSIKNSPRGSLILMDLVKHSDFAEFHISDNGHGIPEKLLDNLFNAHTPGRDREVDSVSGLGIGLSICQTIVSAHGGSIIGRNRQDGGAHFMFSLPLI